MVTREAAERDSGKGIATTVRKGLASLRLADYDLIAKFDADLDFPPDYLERCIGHFSVSIVGLVGGVCSIETPNGWVIEKAANLDHVRGALKLYRREALEAIGTIVEGTGWDTIDEHTLRHLGYEVVVDATLVVRQHRKTNAGTPVRRMARKIGLSLFNMGASYPVATISLLKRASLFGGDMPLLPMVSAYLQARARGASPLVSRDVARFANAYRWRQFWRRLTRH